MSIETTDEARKPYRVRHALKFRVVQVADIIQLSQHMLRIVFQGDELADFNSAGFDDHVKVFFPAQAGGELVVPGMTENGLSFPEGYKPVMRDYTPLRFDNAARTLTIDFVIHDAGPATTWAQQAKIGDQLVIGGPRGSMIIPLAYDAYVFFGDDAALPAIARRLQELPAESRALVVAEVNTELDKLDLASPAQVDVVWLYRQGQPAGQAQGFIGAIEQLAQQAQWPAGDTFSWVAAETSVARQLRKLLIERFGLPKDRIKAAGYWQHGTAGAHTSIGDE